MVYHLFKALDKRPPLKVDPDSENDVITLFSGLIAADELKGYRIQALSGFNTYDGLVEIKIMDQELNDYEDPLSLRQPLEKNEGKFKVLEFKQVFESLIKDFESNKKNPREIDIAVCWSLPDLNTNRGNISYVYEEKSDLREFYGVTHVWEDITENPGVEIPIISLKHYVAIRLSDIEKENESIGLGTAKFKEMLQADQELSI